ncbi:hypothetical protein TWF481_011627 [Arthrobotrys musiformis]|uniref:Uncharacterized protein n=1 Tax=Arthrobotrys musiformis TaxID=47236 RepID=A0AAV9VZ07_9PEZI
MDKIQDLPTPSSLAAFIHKTNINPSSPIALIQFYNGASSIQWAASTVYQTQQILSQFSKEIADGTLIVGRIDGTVLPSRQYNEYRRLDSDYREVSYGLYWQGIQQVYEIDALGSEPSATLKREIGVLLELRAGGAPVDDQRRRSIARRVARPGSLLRWAPRARTYA